MKSIKRVVERGIEKEIVRCDNNAELVGRVYNGNSKKGVILIPGFSEHKFSLYDIAERLNNEGYNVWAFDLNGQGESGGNWNLEEMAESIGDISKTLKDNYGLDKLGAFGNSLGGMAVGLSAASDKDSLDRICLSGAPTALQEVIPKRLIQILN
jgi:alpha-beta hydrolase superfamily lysophospholipase